MFSFYPALLHALAVPTASLRTTRSPVLSSLSILYIPPLLPLQETIMFLHLVPVGYMCFAVSLLAIAFSPKQVAHANLRAIILT